MSTPSKKEAFGDEPLLKQQDTAKSIPKYRKLESLNSKYTDDKRKQDLHTKVVLFGSLLLNVFLIILNGITVDYMVSEQSKITRNSNTCLNCSELKLHPDDDLSLFDVYEGNVCCVKHGGNYSTVVEKLVTKNLKESLISESPQYQPLYCRREDRVVSVIKLVGKLTNIPPPDTRNSRFPWLQWTTDIPGSTDGLLSNDHTHITVDRTGIYQIYSQLVFHNRRVEGPSSYSSGSDRYYVHAIYKTSTSGHDERLLGGSYTYYRNQNGETEVSSYIGSPYQLRKGDRIGVKVHDVSQVVPSNLTNFFGMHLIQ